MTGCVRTVVKETIITDDAGINAYIKKLENDFEECERLKDVCCDIVEENLINN